MVFDSPGNFWSWVVWVWFSLSLFSVLGLDFQALSRYKLKKSGKAASKKRLAPISKKHPTSNQQKGKKAEKSC